LEIRLRLGENQDSRVLDFILIGQRWVEREIELVSLVSSFSIENGE